MLEDYVDEEVQLYIKGVREHGRVVSSGVVMAADQGILLSCAKKS